MEDKNKKPIVVILGRPNVGKSTLFNRLAEQRIAIVDETRGVTRDVISAECEWNSYRFLLQDTGGLGEESEDVLRALVSRKAWETAKKSDLIVFLTDVRSGVTKEELELRKLLFKLRKPIILAVNKVDSSNFEVMAEEFRSLGFEKMVFISALSGRNISELCDLIVENINWKEFPSARLVGAKFCKLESETPTSSIQEHIRVAIFGKRNVGKSSLLNTILQEDKVLISEIPGTTRDAISQEVIYKGINFTFTDTAGLMKVSKMDDVEFYSYARSQKALGEAQVCLLMLDAQRGVEEMDKRVAKRIEAKAKSVIIIVNKWDLFENKRANRELMSNHVYSELRRLAFAPIVFMSAKEKTGISELFSQIIRVSKNYKRNINNSVLWDVLKEEIAITPPPIVKNKTLKIYSAEQVSTAPPTFKLKVNERRLLRKAYRNFLENVIRRHFDFTGTHIRLVFDERRKKQKSERLR